MAWTLARTRKAAGNYTQAREFAQIALKEIGDGLPGSALMGEMTEFLGALETEPGADG